MNIDDAGIDLVKLHEGCKLVAYQDMVGVWTIGYGSTGSNVYEGLHITEEHAEEMLRKDLATAERCVSNSVKVPITQGQFNALCSFVFNLGCGSLGKSTLLAKLNAGEDDEIVAKEFLRWTHAGGVEVRGLVIRRTAEMKEFLA